ncbi:NADPH-dependent FMN reductase [Streptomyces sp. NPDC054933]
MSKIAIILGSTRPGRVGEAVARWVLEQAEQRTDATFELIDLAEVDLPPGRRTDAARFGPLHPPLHAAMGPAPSLGTTAMSSSPPSTTALAPAC